MKNIIVYLVIIVGTIARVHGQGHNYYVANAGSDQNNGFSTNTPFQTINKVNSLVLGPGDKVFFKRGDIFRGQINLTHSGTSSAHIVVDAYGVGKSPIIAGATPISGWVKKGGNVWQASCPQCGTEVTGLYRNSIQLPLGRYPKLNSPNMGYLTVQSHTGYTQLTGQEHISQNWSGGEIVYRPYEWVIDKRTITGQSGNTFNLDATVNAKNNSKYNIQDNWGYFIQNHPSTLTENGEWCYNKTTKTILLYWSNSNPNNEAIDVATFSKALHIEGSSFVDIFNINFSEALNYNIYINNSSNIVLENDTITNAGENGVTITGGQGNVTMEHNHINHINNNGIEIRGVPKLTFLGNTVEDVGTIPGRGKSGDQQYFAFQYFDDDGGTLIANNVFARAGYVGIGFFGSNITVRNNLILDYDLIKSDGGGIYTYKGANPKERSNQKIEGNIILNAKGPKEGSRMKNTTYSNATGIYLDDCTQNIDVTGNTVANCSGPGIYMHGTSNANVSGNTLFNNGAQVTILNSHFCAASGNSVQSNILFSEQPNQVLARYENGENPQSNISAFGTIDNNFYYSLSDGKFAVNINNNKQVLAFKDWANTVGKDGSSVVKNLRIANHQASNVIFQYNFTKANKVITFNGTYTDIKNNTYQGQATILPFSSIILIKKD